MAAGLAVAAFAQSACQETNHPQASGADASTPKTSLRTQRAAADKASRDEQRRQYEEEAANLQTALDTMNSKHAQNSDAPSESPASETATGGSPNLPLETTTTVRPPRTDAAGDRPPYPPLPTLPPTSAVANRTASVPDSSAPIAVNGMTGRTPEQRRADAVAELGLQLRPDISGAKDPLRTAMPLMGLELISPGSSTQDLDSIRAAVSPEQRRAVESACALVRSFATDPNLTSGNPADLAQAMRAEADRLVGPQSTNSDTLALGEVAMCQRVDGFGRFTPLASNAFFAGKPAAMILYTEIENFSQTSALETPGASGGTEAGKWNVELGQTVKLYYEADGSEQLVLPETVVHDGSRSKRHDFFLVQRVDLPRTLSVGNYTLKVIVRDAGGSSGSTGALAERIVPIRIVADASAVGSASQRGAGSTTSSPSAATTQPTRRGPVVDRRP
jgi:hypothetical protein